MIFTNFVTDPIKVWINHQIKRIPLLNTLYTSIKDFTEAFVGDAKNSMNPCW
ncbi:DUF502 domain-containing protein [Sphingobacterium sp. E70]|uniref:DUF502 domain-containing protein n=1 Tax=Sphingobacterium sp. E70 TaxID=2853439 RepID=UPI002795B71A|nr:DUF502 domain-containing protein [Sphingobacterium sp. E70]